MRYTGISCPQNGGSLSSFERPVDDLPVVQIAVSGQISHAAVKQTQIICKFICFYFIFRQCSKYVQKELSILVFSEAFVFWKMSSWTPKRKLLGSSYQPSIPTEESSASEDPIATSSDCAW